MPAYKRQHYLPVAYLKYFSVDQSHCSRDSRVWRFDGREQRLVRVDSQCAANYHYSKAEPASAEALFQKIESRYCNCIDKIKQRRRLSDQEYGDLLLSMFDFYIRNAVHENKTGKEGIDAYRVRSQIFLSKILLSKEGDFTNEDIQKHIYSYWGLRIVAAPRGHAFITCDHPSVWTSVNDNQPGLHLLTLPISPSQTAVAYDKRILEVMSDDASDEDYLTLNDTQIQNSVSCIYASGALPEEQVDLLRKHLWSKENPNCDVDGTRWRLKLAGIRREHHFSFVRLMPPLM